MNLIGPFTYELSFDALKFSVRCPAGTAKFSGAVCSRLPKLYVVSLNAWPIYIGVTKQPIRNRLRLGWSATGANGYHGYAWRHKCTEATLDVWCHTDPGQKPPEIDVETVEAEVVYLIRQHGQWPAFQTEIHFHRSDRVHRDAAAEIFGRYHTSQDTNRSLGGFELTNAIVSAPPVHRGST